MFFLKRKLMFQCLQIFCNAMLNANTPKFHKINFLTKFLISFELFIVTHSFPVCIMCLFVPSDCMLRVFFQLNCGRKKVGCLLYLTPKMCHSWGKKSTSRKKYYQFFFTIFTIYIFHIKYHLAFCSGYPLYALFCYLLQFLLLWC